MATLLFTLFVLCGLCKGFLDDCPNPCMQGDRQVCPPVQCSKPQCDNPVTPEGACCAECPTPDCPYPCSQGGKHYCYHLPCPLPPCNNSISLPGVCCPVCPTPECPHPCMIGGKRYCHPVPCPRPPCDKPVTPEGMCCPVCPHDLFSSRGNIDKKDCPHPCTYNGHHYCEPIPCPPPWPPNCTHPYTPPGGCCEISCLIISTITHYTCV